LKKPGIGAGEFDHKIIYNSRDALGKLANSFNKMASSLKDNQVQLEAEIVERNRAERELLTAHDELELRVEKRTLELSEANEQLQNEIDLS
jgi:nitrate/nitrite-specific signal transduction histidine kinase